MGIQLSFSACQRYLLSSFSYYAHYMLRLRPVDTGSALVFGSALDAAFNALLGDKRDGREISIDRARAMFDEVFRATDPNTIKYSKADFDTTSLPESFLLASSDNPAVPLAWHCLKYKGYLLIEEYASQVLPRIEKVYEIQKTISLKNEVGDEFTGVIDFIAQIDGKIWIVDNKSSSVRYAENSVSESGQLATYFEAMKDEYDLAGACFIVVPKGLRKKKKPIVDISFIFGSIPDTLIDKTFQDYENVLEGVKTGKFECTRSQRDGCCSMPWGCAYKRYCESGGKDMTGLKYEEKKK